MTLKVPPDDASLQNKSKREAPLNIPPSGRAAEVKGYQSTTTFDEGGRVISSSGSTLDEGGGGFVPVCHCCADESGAEWAPQPQTQQPFD